MYIYKYKSKFNFLPARILESKCKNMQALPRSNNLSRTKAHSGLKHHKNQRHDNDITKALQKQRRHTDTTKSLKHQADIRKIKTLQNIAQTLNTYTTKTLKDIIMT